MKKFLTNAFLTVLMGAGLFAFADAVIFNGDSVKALKPNLKLRDNSSVMSGTVDPTSSATSANPGSLYLNSSTGKTYRKTDSGSSTNWVELVDTGTSSVDSQALGVDAFVNGSYAVSASGGNLLIELKDRNGADPSGSSKVKFAFPQSAGEDDSGFTILTVEQPLAITIPSGATLGFSNSTANQRIYVYAVNIAGTVELAVSAFDLPDTLRSATAIDTTADDGATLYANSSDATTYSRRLGAIHWNSAPATAGTWSVSASYLIPNLLNYSLETVSSSNSTGTNVPASAVIGCDNGIILTPGNWEINLVMNYSLNGGTSSGNVWDAWISTTSGNSITGRTIGDNYCLAGPPSTGDSSCAVPNYRVTVTNITTYYAKCRAQYSAGTPQYRYRINARRYR